MGRQAVATAVETSKPFLSLFHHYYPPCLPYPCEEAGAPQFLAPSFSEEEMTRKILDLHGREIRGFPKKLQVREVEQHWSVEETFREVGYQMELQEKTAGY